MRRALLLTGAGFSAPLLLLAVLLVAGPGAAPAAAQSESGGASLEGSVHGRDGQAVPNASVRIVATDTGFTRSVVTRSDGRFVAPMLPVGRYSIEVSASGQGTGKRDNVLLRVGATQTVDIELEPVDARARGGQRADRGLDRRRPDRPDRARRQPDDRPGLDLGPAGARPELHRVRACSRRRVIQESDRFGLVISGQRSINSNVAIDGADFNDPLQGNQRGGNEASSSSRSPRSTSSRSCARRRRASVGRTTAGFVNVVTKSGTNAAARRGLLLQPQPPAHLGRRVRPQARTTSRTSSAARSAGRSQPTRRYFFVAAEQNLLRVPFVVKFQDQAAGVVVPAELTALEGEQHGTNNPTALFARVDVQLSPGAPPEPAVHLLAGCAARTSTSTLRRSTRPRRPTTCGRRRATASRSRWRRCSGPACSTSSPRSSRPTTASEQPNLGMPQIVITGFGTLGGDTGRPRVFETTRYQVADNLNLLLEKHRLRFGFDLNLTPSHQQRESNILGRYDFTSLRQLRGGQDQPLSPDAARLRSRRPGLRREPRGSWASSSRTGPASGAVTVNAGPALGRAVEPHAAAPESRRARDRQDPERPEDVAAAAGSRLVARRPGRTRGSGDRRHLRRAHAGEPVPARLHRQRHQHRGRRQQVDKSVLSQLTFPNALAAVPAGSPGGAPADLRLRPGLPEPARQAALGGLRAADRHARWPRRSATSTSRPITCSAGSTGTSRRPRWTRRACRSSRRRGRTRRSGSSRSTSRRRSRATTRW